MTDTALTRDALRTDVHRYARHKAIALKYADVGASGEVSTIAIARLFEDGRYMIRSHIDHPIARDRQVGFVLARVRIDLLEPLYYPGTVDVAIGVGRAGRSSFDYVTALFQYGHCVALSDATVAVRDRSRGTGNPLDPSFHAALAPLHYAR